MYGQIGRVFFYSTRFNPGIYLAIVFYQLAKRWLGIWLHARVTPC